VARGDAQGLLLTASADEERQRSLHRLGHERGVGQLVVLAVERGALVGEQALDHLAGFVEAREALAERVERDAVGAVLVLLPARAEAEHDAAAAHVVERRGHLREHGRVAVGVAHDQRPEAQARDGGGERREDRPRLLPGTARVLPVWHEVIGPPEAVPARLLHVAGEREHVGVGLGGRGPEAQAHGGLLVCVESTRIAVMFGA
jgi:hypothetical protein